MPVQHLQTTNSFGSLCEARLSPSKCLQTEKFIDFPFQTILAPNSSSRQADKIPLSPLSSIASSPEPSHDVWRLINDFWIGSVAEEIYECVNNMNYFMNISRFSWKIGISNLTICRTRVDGEWVSSPVCQLFGFCREPYRDAFLSSSLLLLKCRMRVMQIENINTFLK